jgi:hypothetical protein
MIAHPLAPTGDIHDFDFLAGSWNVVNRRLKRRWCGSDDWDVFPATHRFEKHLDGIANVDEMRCPARGFSGMSVRAFDLVQRRWAIYWIDSAHGVLFPPVYGGFTGVRGEFYGNDIDEGIPVEVRFVWLRRDPDTLRWEQAFSRDGRTWETNWIMDFTREATMSY